MREAPAAGPRKQSRVCGRSHNAPVRQHWVCCNLVGKGRRIQDRAVAICSESALCSQTSPVWSPGVAHLIAFLMHPRHSKAIATWRHVDPFQDHAVKVQQASPCVSASALRNAKPSMRKSCTHSRRLSRMRRRTTACPQFSTPLPLSSGQRAAQQGGQPLPTGFGGHLQGQPTETCRVSRHHSSSQACTPTCSRCLHRDPAVTMGCGCLAAPPL